jgi:hypothetical protein
MMKEDPAPKRRAILLSEAPRKLVVLHVPDLQQEDERGRKEDHQDGRKRSPEARDLMT